MNQPQFEKYSVKKLIGKGGMATVWVGEHKGLGQPVAIKILNQEVAADSNIRKRFLSEAKAMFQMNHPHIVRVIDLIEENNQVAFVMEYVKGSDLKDFLEQFGPLSKNVVISLFTQMLDAVGYVHNQGFVHRDIKPSNFMITEDKMIRLMDFGIAKNLDLTADYTATGTSQFLGTPIYMSPEQVKGSANVTQRSDIYALGVVLWQMVSGRKPYDLKTLSLYEVQHKIVSEPLSLTKTIFDPLIEKATAKDPGARFQSCQEMANSLSDIEKGNFSTVYQTSIGNKIKIDRVSQPAPAEAKKSNSNWIIISFLTIIGFTILVFVLQKPKQTDSPVNVVDTATAPTVKTADEAPIVPAAPDPVVIHTTSGEVKTIMENYYRDIPMKSFDAYNYFSDHIDYYLGSYDITPSEANQKIANSTDYQEGESRILGQDPSYDRSELNKDYWTLWIYFTCYRPSKEKYQSCRVKVEVGFDIDKKICSYKELKVEDLQFTDNRE